MGRTKAADDQCAGSNLGLNWEYGFHAMRPRDDFPLGMSSGDDPYLETNSIIVSAFIVKPKKMADRAVRIELKPYTLLDARDDGQVRARPIGEWWSERGVFVGSALIPHHAAATIVSALSARKIAYLTISAAVIRGRGGSEIYGVELSTAFDPEMWD